MDDEIIVQTGLNAFFEGLMNSIIIYANICAVIYSICLAVDGREDRIAVIHNAFIKYHKNFYLLFKPSLCLALFAILIQVMLEISDAYKSDSIKLPWFVIFDFSGSDNIFHHIMRTTACILFSLWAFVIPARIWSVNTSRASGEFLAWPYIVNILIGLLLSTPNNPIVGAIVWYGHNFADTPYGDGEFDRPWPDGR